MNRQSMADHEWALITGASAGIGVELARLFAADGYSLVLVARRADRLQALADELSAAHGTRVEVLPMDLAAAGASQALHDAVAAKGIVLHTLVNNAGFGLRGPFHALPADRQSEMMQLNMVALTELSRLFLPGMIERRRGGILNVASMAAFQAGPYMAVYYATKAYVLSLSEALHEEAKPFGVKVSALCPGPVATEFASVADLHGSKLFSSAADAKSVALAGYEGYRANVAIEIPGALNRIGSVLGKFAPRILTRRVAGQLQKSRAP
jgi:short-subunit dehydrogenase